MTLPNCVFLDTNVFIIGGSDPNTEEGIILKWLGFGEIPTTSVEVIVSQELFEQVLRVAKRLQNKDWSGELLGRIWRNPNIRYVLLDTEELARLEALAAIPREDIEIYLTAKTGNADCFISSNHKLIRALVEQNQEFECLTPAEFVKKYLSR